MVVEAFLGNDGSAMPCAIGLDLGGSSAKVGLVSDAGELLAHEAIAVPDAPDPLAVLEPIVQAVERLSSAGAERSLTPIALGCGVSGYLDARRKRIELNNTAALDGFAIGPWLEERFRLPVALDNDACMAAIAESALVSPLHARRVLFVAVGSGIGVVLVVDGQVARIMHGITGDAAHMVVAPQSEERCPIRCRGCLETVASARAIARAGQRAASSGASPLLAEALAAHGAVTGADVSAAAARGDRTASEIIRQAGRWLGAGLASWAAVYGPDMVLLGGGVAQAGTDWLNAAVAAMSELGGPYFVDRVVVRRATLGNRAGVIGAGLVAMREARAMRAPTGEGK